MGSCGDDGLVLLLTEPSCLGYHQNPISVYYCYRADGSLASCLAEVTNTPWTERVVFPFEPTGDTVPKPLHVSPFIDMYRNWRISSSDPLASSSPTDESDGSNGNGSSSSNGSADGDGVRVVAHPDEVDSSSTKLAPTLDVTVLTLPKSPLGKVFTAAMQLQCRRVTYEPWGWSLQVRP
mmetsp:Transcript_64072/g.177045  ORF Transcript_64072/g.177045 Transcript_64072/m.177045 type:complete len:179 (-) Transcript_64072:780-1316(-)